MAFISAFSPIYRRRVAKFVSETVQKRFMAGIGGPTIPPPGGYTGIDKIVRTYLPEDYQVSFAILCFYATLIAGFSIRSSFKKKKQQPPAVKEEAATM